MQRVAIVAGCRTPFVKAGGPFAEADSRELGRHIVRALWERMQLKDGDLDEMVFSTVLLDPRRPNLAREVLFAAGLPKGIPAHFVSNNCISGLVAANIVAEGIRSGRIRSGFAGGVESMSCPALTLSRRGEKFFLKLARARSMGEKLGILGSFRPGFLLPEAPSPKEPSTGLTMGQHCEITTQEMAIPRAEQDALAFRSHKAAAAAHSAGKFKDDIVPFAGVDRDLLVRGETTVEKLASLKPVFERSAKGTLTAGNSSALTDGASVVCLASESYARERGWKILAFLDAVEFSAVSPDDGLLMAPGVALPRLFQRHGLKIGDIARFEVHEAFAAQVLANMRVWEKGWTKHPEVNPIGVIPADKLNVWGGSLALGHPFAATGGRMLLMLARELTELGRGKGVISVCAAGSMACAMLLSKE